MTDDNTASSSARCYTSVEQQESLVCCCADTNVTVRTSTLGTQALLPPIHLQHVATSPELDTGNEFQDLRPVGRQRPRSKSAPSILYEQVALQLRDISDEFNREYSHEQVRRKFVVAVTICVALVGSGRRWSTEFR